MFSSCSHGGREADWRERKKKELIRDRERDIESEMGTFRDREAVRKEIPREVGKGQASSSCEEIGFRSGGELGRWYSAQRGLLLHH